MSLVETGFSSAATKTWFSASGRSMHKMINWTRASNETKLRQLFALRKGSGKFRRHKATSLPKFPGAFSP
jgi:hypothetical protein